MSHQNPNSFFPFPCTESEAIAGCDRRDEAVLKM